MQSPALLLQKDFRQPLYGYFRTEILLTDVVVLTKNTAQIAVREKDSTGKIVFYDGLDENLIKEKYPPIHYKIIWANENYAALHEGKEAGKVYAISTHPNIKKEELSEKKFVLGGVPTLVEFENHKVINFYFDDKEIIDFLESDTQPLDKYWNLE